MIKLIKSAALSALIGLGAIAAMPAAAQAQSGGFYLGFGSGHGPSVGFHFDDRGRQYDRGGRHDRGRNYDRGGYRNHGHVRGCSVREALNKASRMGLRHPRVVGENRRVIHVQGRAHGYRFAEVAFGRAPHCPVLR